MTTPQATRRAVRALMLLIAFAAVAATWAAQAQGQRAGARPRGDHPAIVVQRLQRGAGYDYPSKFYPHPAGFYLLPASPDELERMQWAARAALIDATPDDGDDALPGLLAQH